MRNYYPKKLKYSTIPAYGIYTISTPLLTILPQNHCWITSFNKAEIHPKPRAYYQDQVTADLLKLPTIQNPPLPNVSVLIFTLYFQLGGMHIKESILCLLPSNDFLKWFISVTSVHVSKLPWLLSLILWWFQNMKIHMTKLSKMWNGSLLILLLIQWPCLLSSLWAPFFMSLPKTCFGKIFLVFFYHHTSRDLINSNAL